MRQLVPGSAVHSSVATPPALSCTSIPAHHTHIKTQVKTQRQSPKTQLPRRQPARPVTSLPHTRSATDPGSRRQIPETKKTYESRSRDAKKAVVLYLDCKAASHGMSLTRPPVYSGTYPKRTPIDRFLWSRLVCRPSAREAVRRRSVAAAKKTPPPLGIREAWRTGGEDFGRLNGQHIQRGE